MYRSTEESDWELVKKTSSTSYTDKNAEAGVKYYYQVKSIASKSAGNSEYSSINCKTCDLPQPVITVGNDSSTGQVKLSWETIDGAASYQVSRASKKTGTYEDIGFITSTSYTDTTGTLGKAYYYKVKAISDNEDANSAYSAVKSGRSISLNGKLNSSGVPYLSWTKVNGASKYRVYRSMTRTGGYSLMSTRSTCSYSNTNAIKGMTLYYKIKALDSSGNVLATSNIVTVTTDPPQGETFKNRYIAAPQLMLYELPTTSSSSVRARYMDELQRGSAVLSSNGLTWYRVLYQDELMYLRMEKKSGVLTEKKRSTTYTGKTPYQQQILDLATDISENWNTTYVSGMAGEIANSNGDHGFNCSGLVKYVFNTVMQEHVPTYNLEASLETLMSMKSVYNKGYPGEFSVKKVKYADRQPGDILFFASRADGTVSKNIGHCGIYLGNNEFVHSTSLWSDSVCISPLTDAYKDTLRHIRRFLPKTVTPANTEATLSDAYETCSIHAEMDSDSEVVTTIAAGETLTILFTNSDKWAYVRAASGTEGFVQVKYLQ